MPKTVGMDGGRGGGVWQVQPEVDSVFMSQPEAISFVNLAFGDVEKPQTFSHNKPHID